MPAGSGGALGEDGVATDTLDCNGALGRILRGWSGVSEAWRRRAGGLMDELLRMRVEYEWETVGVVGPEIRATFSWASMRK